MKKKIFHFFTRGAAYLGLKVNDNASRAECQTKITFFVCNTETQPIFEGVCPQSYSIFLFRTAKHLSIKKRINQR